jgi:hypothetical protein
MWDVTTNLLTLPLLAAMLAPGLAAQSAAATRTTYFPAAGTWQHKAPADAGMDAGKLKEAIDWAEAHGSKWDFEKDQVRVFGKVLGALRRQRTQHLDMIWLDNRHRGPVAGLAEALPQQQRDGYENHFEDDGIEEHGREPRGARPPGTAG